MVGNNQTEFKIALLGESMAEISGQPFSPMQQGIGGDSMNTAIYLKTLLPEQGVVSFVTAMGTDLLSKSIIEKWQGYRLDTSKVLINKDKHVGLYYIQNDDSGERFFQYWRNDSAARYMMQHDGINQVFDELLTYNAVFLSGISVAVLPPKDRVALLEQLQELSWSGVKIIFDGNYRPKLWASTDEAKSIYEQMYRLSDLALVTFDDEQLLWHDEDVASCQQRLSAFDIHELVIKDGANGCLYVSQGQTVPVPTTPVANVVDTTAAGDSFNAGFLSGWLMKRPATQCCLLGNQLAGQVIQQKGAIVDIDLSAIDL